ncbi:MAG: hypothetical protein ABS36_08700 [Acidobacteria bacterium SCN 69-37]|nr:MAG: hypothetical protein ABS36_08700 [Acidobacteria bacterium SCN 69-37]
MKTYTVLFAEDVPHYGSVEIEASSDEAALEAALVFDLTEATLEPDWQNGTCRRIVQIECPDGRTMAEGTALDGTFLRHGGDEERRLCDAAPALRDALRRIAATPLWGESLPEGELRDAYAEHGEYDLAEQSFEPCCDTESTLLQDAVEMARFALRTLEGRGS